EAFVLGTSLCQLLRVGQLFHDQANVFGSYHGILLQRSATGSVAAIWSGANYVGNYKATDLCPTSKLTPQLLPHRTGRRLLVQPGQQFIDVGLGDLLADRQRVPIAATANRLLPGGLRLLTLSDLEVAEQIARTDSPETLADLRPLCAVRGKDEC